MDEGTRDLLIELQALLGRSQDWKAMAGWQAIAMALGQVGQERDPGEAAAWLRQFLARDPKGQHQLLYPPDGEEPDRAAEFERAKREEVTPNEP